MSDIGFGTWAWGNKIIWGYRPEKDNVLLEKAFNKAIQGGLTFIDTADSYGIGNLNGQSEKLLGDYIEKLPDTQKKKLTIATKLAPFPWRQGKNSVKQAFISSKRRLKGNLNRVQIHWSTSRYAPWQEVQFLDCLADLFENESLTELGLSNFGPNRLKWMHARLQKRGIPLKSLQIQFSLLASPSINEQKIKDFCKEKDIELIAYSPLALGILAIPPERLYSPSTFIRNRIFQQVLPKTIPLRTTLNNIGKRYKASQVEVALNWCRSHGTKPIPGIRNPSQVQALLSALTWKLTQQEKDILDQLRKKCPIYMPVNPFQSS